jgi:hypothetical protein
MANNYKKADYRLYTDVGLVLGAQVEGLPLGAFPRMHNTKIYREGAIGLRDQRDFFAGIKTGVGRPAWIDAVTRFDSDYILGFCGTSLYAWRRSIPEPSLVTEDAGLVPGVRTSSNFLNFLPQGGVPTLVSVLPNDKSNPAMYFTKPGVARMWKAYLVSKKGEQTGGAEPRPGGIIGGGLGVPPNMTGEEEEEFRNASILPTETPHYMSGGLQVAFWGLNAPTGHMTATLKSGTAGGQNSTVSGGILYDYVWTHLNTSTGSESNPSAGLPAIIGSNLTAIELEIPVDTGGDPQIDAIRIYRKGGILTDYHQLAEVALTTMVAAVTGSTTPGVETVKFTDVKKDNDIKFNKLLQLDNFVPFISTTQGGDTAWNATCALIFGPFNPGNVILGIGEANKKGSVFWTNPGRPDSTNATNNVEVTTPNDPLVSGCVYNGIPYVASRGDWYALDPLRNPDSSITFLPRKTQVGRGPIGPWAMAVGMNIFFMSSDGVFATDGQSVSIEISANLRPIFHGEGVGPNGEYSAVDLTAPQDLFRLYWAAPDLHFIYPDTQGRMRHLIYDGQKWRSEDFAVKDSSGEPWDNLGWPELYPSCVFHDSAWPQRQVLIGTNKSAITVVQPYASTAREISDWDWDGTLGIGTSDPTIEYGWVLGHFRTPTDDFDAPALLKTLGDVSFEARNKALAAVYNGIRGKVLLTLFSSSEGGSEEVGERLPSSSVANVPIGSTILNSSIAGRERFVFDLNEVSTDRELHNLELYSCAWDFKFYGPWEFHNMTVFYQPGTEVIRHWHSDNVQVGDGWGHIRDGYIDATFYGPATLRVMLDENSFRKYQTVEFDPAAVEENGGTADKTGIRYKYYFSLDAMKGKKFTFTLDCPDGMQLNGEGCEVNGKPWVTQKGYGNMNPFSVGA